MGAAAVTATNSYSESTTPKYAALDNTPDTSAGNTGYWRAKYSDDYLTVCITNLKLLCLITAICAIMHVVININLSRNISKSRLDHSLDMCD